MQEENGGGLVYHIDVDLIKKARIYDLQANIEKVKAQIENAEQNLELIKTAENALGKIQIALQQMREIAVDAATDPDADRGALSRRFEDCKAEVDEIVASATYEGVNLLDGSMGSINKVIAAVNATMFPAGQ